MESSFTDFTISGDLDLESMFPRGESNKDGFPILEVFFGLRCLGEKSRNEVFTGLLRVFSAFKSEIASAGTLRAPEC